MLGSINRAARRRSAGRRAWRLRCWRVLRDARIIRAHDVAATVDALQAVAAVAGGAGPTKGRRLRKLGRKYFGTDGVRGRVGEHPMTVDFALNLASAAARVLAPDGGTVLNRQGHPASRATCLSPRSKRASSPPRRQCDAHRSAADRPGLPTMTRRFECDFGAVISASHNLYDDNGITILRCHRSELSDDLEERIELEIEQGPVTRASRNLGRATRVDRSRHLLSGVLHFDHAAGMDLSGLKIVIDCANGAAYKVGPRMLADLGAEIVPVGCLAQRPQHQRWLRLNSGPISCR